MRIHAPSTKIRQAFADAFDTVVLGRRGFTSFRCDVDRFIESGQGITVLKAYNRKYLHHYVPYCLDGCWPVELRLAACQSLSLKEGLEPTFFHRPPSANSNDNPI